MIIIVTRIIAITVVVTIITINTNNNHNNHNNTNNSPNDNLILAGKSWPSAVAAVLHMGGTMRAAAEPVPREATPLSVLCVPPVQEGLWLEKLGVHDSEESTLI